MEIRNDKNEVDRNKNEIDQRRTQIESEVNNIVSKLARVQSSKDSKLNNVRAVRGDDFDDSPENLMVLAEIES